MNIIFYKKKYFEIFNFENKIKNINKLNEIKYNI